MSLAHVSYGADRDDDDDEPVLDLGNKNDLTPFLGSKIKDKVFNTGKGVLSPVAGHAMAPANMVRHRGKKTFEKLKTTPMDGRETDYDRRMRERRPAPLDTETTLNTPSNGQQGVTMDVSETVVETSPTAPGQPRYPMSSSEPTSRSEKGEQPIRPSTDTAQAGYRTTSNGEEYQGPRESEDGIPLTRLSSRSGTHETPPSRDPEAQEDHDENGAYFALPGGPGVRNQDETDGNDPDAFFPPATKEPQMILWLPKDDLGLCEYEIEQNAAAGVESSCRRAILNHEGKVRISGPPPIHGHLQPVYPV